MQLQEPVFPSLKLTTDTECPREHGLPFSSPLSDSASKGFDISSWTNGGQANVEGRLDLSEQEDKERGGYEIGWRTEEKRKPNPTSEILSPGKTLKPKP